MQENNKLWLEIKEMFETSQTEVTIFNNPVRCVHS